MLVQLLGEVGRKVQLAVKGPAVWQARAGTRVCEARLEGMGAVHTRTENVLEVRWWQHQRRDILDMYDEVVGKEVRWGDHCKVLVLPDGSMKGWEKEGLCFDRPPKDEVSWVRLGRTREAAIF